MVDAQTYIIPDPSGWIISVRAIVDASEQNSNPYFISINLFDDNYSELIHSVQTFNYVPEDGGDFVEPQLINSLAKVAYNVIATNGAKRPDATKVAFLVAHENINLAHSIVSILMDVPLLMGFETIAAIGTDETVWDDVLLVRAGLVDKELVTDYKLDLMVNGRDSKLFINRDEAAGE